MRESAVQVKPELFGQGVWIGVKPISRAPSHEHR
jgi:hypothetical protein